MRFVTARYEGQQRVAIEAESDPDQLGLLHPSFSSVLDVIDAGDQVPAPLEWVVAEDVLFLAPVPSPRRNILCVGMNYREHSKEFALSGFDTSAAAISLPEFPIVFSKFGSSVVGSGETIDLLSNVTTQVDYEAELAVLIGKQGRDIPVDEAMDFVWGYTAINDVTARDRQKRHRQWLLGKTLDGFCPMGPRAVTHDEVDLADTHVSCHVNDELRQEANTRELIFSVPEIISVISEGFTLQPGDVIATGTPAGVGIGYDPPRFLKSGDCVRIEIANVGILENTFK
jgi:2-keto-4-pentenoate hydratase/2-oxohepta-3-ene-1,7-dioic acid hydratase in catechol pathway